MSKFDKGKQLQEEGKLEKALAPNPRALDPKPKLNYIEIEQIFKERNSLWIFNKYGKTLLFNT